MDILHRKLTDMGGNHHNGICVAGKKEKKKSIVIYLFIYIIFFLSLGQNKQWINNLFFCKSYRHNYRLKPKTSKDIKNHLLIDILGNVKYSVTLLY